MAIFKRGKFYWYHFVFNGEHVQRSTKQKNQHVARTIEAAARTALAKGEVGIVERKKVPNFKEAMAAFLEWASQEHQMAASTAERYRYSSMGLIRFFRIGGSTRSRPRKSRITKDGAPLSAAQWVGKILG